MATAVLFIGWNRPHPGKEQEAYRHLMSEGVAALDQFQKSGFYETREHVGLTPHGGDLNGFILLFGERAKLDELRRTDEFEKFSMRLGAMFTGYGVIPGLNRNGIDSLMKRSELFR